MFFWRRVEPDLPGSLPQWACLGNETTSRQKYTKWMVILVSRSS